MTMGQGFLDKNSFVIVSPLHSVILSAILVI